ncbi:MAG TPA: galactose-1-phosphate uridylyltransferase [Urbifossiella sp.]|nr:galactose-1-phosphate uridylyltransferase [Urbifossiella sp.]
MTQPSAPEFRRDPVSGWWVIVAPERSLRPLSLEGSSPRHRAETDRETCPFCQGREASTPGETFAIREAGIAPNAPGWQLRVVPNMFPAVRPAAANASGEGLFQALSATGRHEVVIEAAEHIVNPVLLSDDQFRDIFIAYRERLLAHAADPALQSVSIFKNVGAEAGASLGHCHSQIIALPLVPEQIGRELRGSSNYLHGTGRCVFCDLVKAELAAGVRVVAETPGFAAIAAYAGRFNHETWVLPKQHASRFETLSDSQAAELAELMKRLLRAFDRVLGEPAYNWYLHAAPLRSAEMPHYHWHLELIPRTARPAGFEWGSGCFLTSVSAETAAAQLSAHC